MATKSARTHVAEMANPVQQGLKHDDFDAAEHDIKRPKWLIQYNKD